MFYKKHRETEKQARMVARAAVEDKISRAVAAAEQIDDPVDKILNLRAIELDLQSAMSDAGRNTKYSGFALLGGVSMPGAALAFTAFLIPHVAVAAGFTMLFTGTVALWGGGAAQKLRDEHMTKMLEAEARAFREKLKATKERVTAIYDAVADEHAEEIISSPRYEDVLKAVPGLTQRFAIVAGKQTVKLKGDIEEARKKSPRQPQKPVLPFKGDYKKFGDALNPKNKG